MNEEPHYRKEQLPALITRITAATIDGLIVIAVFTLTAFLIDTVRQAPAWVRASVLIIMGFLYEPILDASIGGTLGHHLMGIKIRQVNHPEKYLKLHQTLLRFLIKAFLGWISFLTITSNPRKQAIHDMAANSIVLNK